MVRASPVAVPTSSTTKGESALAEVLQAMATNPTTMANNEMIPVAFFLILNLLISISN
jgi:hypothetical protein